MCVVGNVGADVIVYPVDSLPPPGGDVIVDEISIRPAGAAGNTALALSHLGDPCRLVSAIGDDDFGRYVAEALQDRGLDQDVRVTPGAATSASICIEGVARERSFWTVHGALDDFDDDSVPNDAFAHELFLLTGYFTLPGMRGAAAARTLARAKAAGARTLFDTGWDPEGWARTGRSEVLELLRKVDVFLPNEHEARALAGARDLDEAVTWLQRQTGGWVVAKRGADGALARGPRGERVSVPAPRVEATDTTGAGDSLNAGVLHVLAHGGDLPAAVDFGVTLASAVVSRPSRDRYPSLASLRPPTRDESR